MEKPVQMFIVMGVAAGFAAAAIVALILMVGHALWGRLAGDRIHPATWRKFDILRRSLVG